LGDVVEPTLGVIAQGVKETTLNGRTFTYGAGQFLIVSVQLPLVGHITQASADEPLLAFVLKLRPERIASHSCGRSGWPTAGSRTCPARSTGTGRKGSGQSQSHHRPPRWTSQERPARSA
jgi:hypothetical protein